jgi:hypothetical protein
MCERTRDDPEEALRCLNVNPMVCARPAPQRDYTCAEQLAEELRAIFDSGWVMVTRAGRPAGAG